MSTHFFSFESLKQLMLYAGTAMVLSYACSKGQIRRTDISTIKPPILGVAHAREAHAIPPPLCTQKP